MQGAPSTHPETAASLRLISYNIQAGATTANYSDYVTRSWRHVLPYQQRLTNLDEIARLLADYDIVGLQEVDDGSLRTGFINQTQYLAERGGFPFWSHQSNRKVSKLARTCNGLLSRLRPDEVHDHKLPGRIPGRGALAAYYGSGAAALVVVIVHLALGRRSRRIQLDFLNELVSEHAHAIIMGDLNTTCASMEIEAFLGDTGLQPATDGLLSFPSWRPQRAIDHILVSPSLTISRCQAISVGMSDHLPVALELSLPASCSLQT